MALVTTSRRADLDVIHRHRTLLNHFEFTLAREDYTHSKPNPEPYLEALTRFGAEPEEAIVIEDSERGLRAAVAARIPCVVVKNAFTESHDFSSAWKVVDSICDLSRILEPSRSV